MDIASQAEVEGAVSLGDRVLQVDGQQLNICVAVKGKEGSSAREIKGR